MALTPRLLARVGGEDMGMRAATLEDRRSGVCERLIAALGRSPTVDGSACYKHLMGVLLYVLAAPFRWQCASAVGPALEYRDEANTMLEVFDTRCSSRVNGKRGTRRVGR